MHVNSVAVFYMHMAVNALTASNAGTSDDHHHFIVVSINILFVEQLHANRIQLWYVYMYCHVYHIF